MNFQTKIPLNPQEHNHIDYNSKVLMLGSCFVENIGEKLDYFKFQNLQNPFGILFHPLAIENLVTRAINKKVYLENDVFFYNEQWHSFETHSKLNTPSKTPLLKTLNTQINLTHSYLRDATHLIITLGTAWVYRHIETDAVVANCHKKPQKQFLKELLSIDRIVESLEGLLSLIQSINPKLSVIFTISPVRHIKDGFIENQLSKAHLIAAAHKVIDPRKQIYYFPSYEIMMDELRDYRFYTEDMIHPNATAVNYIWRQFQDVWIHKKARVIMQEVDTLQKGLLHKPFAPDSQAHREFIAQLERKAENLKLRHRHMVFSAIG